MTLSNASKKKFRAIGHKLKPIVSIAQKGLTENVKIEINRALRDHELIKIKLLAADKKEKQALEKTICEEFDAHCIQSIGHVMLLYRRAKKQNARLSNVATKK
ncbi:MAG: ribosome assembly RNA-binding protein YhbY [SAR86 cluster bacterium]|uniref:Ribosome assembly RNA-binding protein YhbY n=1 Tax=SAR86 cluster bacterium TaxID=2030880 RepID=A0A2A5AU59_9GAMM|nr:MAG: ribosome assembly RNA-binding protein YhbY [SAR86 cluster bacterium]